MKHRCKAVKKTGDQCSRLTYKEYCNQHQNILLNPGFKKRKRSNKESAGEKKIRLFLRSHKIKFEKQKSFDHPINIDPNIRKQYDIADNLKYYRYDFFLKEYNILIEFDGDQHLGVVNKFHKSKDEYITRRIIDYIKTNILPPNVSLIRINYEFINRIEEILLPCINRVRNFGRSCILYSNPQVYKWLSYTLIELINLSSIEYDNYINK